MRGDRFLERLAAGGGAARFHPAVAVFLEEYLAGEKVVEHGARWVINSNFPPQPGRAFDRLVEQLTTEAPARRLFSVTLAVTNRCPMRCWHCYNAGRSQQDLPLARLRTLASELQELGAAVVTLTGGEPLLRPDLEEIFRAFDDRSALVLGTTGRGLDVERARRLAGAGAWAVGISLDSVDEAEHDRLRGTPGAFRDALAAVEATRAAGLYPYFVTVGTRELLAPERFWPFMEFAGRAGAREVHLLEPCPIGRLAAHPDAALAPGERARILEYQRAVAQREDLPILSTFTYMEGPDAFGCGAGLTHLYIDGSGELCPCNLVPLSFGNVAREPLAVGLDRMAAHFDRPRPACVGRVLARHVPATGLPTPPAVSRRLCEEHLPHEHGLPRFFALRAEAAEPAGAAELTAAYDEVATDYDEHWLSEAGAPVADLVERLALRGDERIFEAGCGTGFATERLCRALGPGGRVTSVDLSEGMLAVARARLERAGVAAPDLLRGDALEELARQRDLDLVFTSWVLGYIPLAPFFSATARALRPGGRLAFIVHRDRSPERELRLFEELVAEDPSVLERPVGFGFPRDREHLASELQAAGLAPVEIREGACTFSLDSADAALRHLLRSGAGTVFYEAVLPERRATLSRRFVERLQAANAGQPRFDVVHRWLACVAGRPA